MDNPFNERLGKDTSSQGAMDKWAVKGQSWIITAAELYFSTVYLILFALRVMRKSRAMKMVKGLE